MSVTLDRYRDFTMQQIKVSGTSQSGISWLYYYHRAYITLHLQRGMQFGYKVFGIFITNYYLIYFCNEKFAIKLFKRELTRKFPYNADLLHQNLPAANQRTSCACLTLLQSIACTIWHRNSTIDRVIINLLTAFRFLATGSFVSFTHVDEAVNVSCQAETRIKGWMQGTSGMTI